MSSIKGLTEEDILNGAGAAFEGGWNKVKLYFMLGLPTETEEDQKRHRTPLGEDRRAVPMRFPKTEGTENARLR